MLAGYLIGKNSFLLGFEFNNLGMTIILSSVGLAIGVLFNFICYYRKLFAATIYQTPIPLTLFFTFWWISNFFASDYIAFFIGIAGLLLGLWLNSILVTPYQFFKIKKRILAFLYLFYSIVILGIFMGVPIFNILMGVFAGNYLAIRIISYINNENSIKRSIHQGALFSALVIAVISILSGLMAFVDIDTYLDTFQSLTHIRISAETFLLFLIIMGIIGVFGQYFITRFTAYTMLQLHNHKKYSTNR